MFLTKGENLSMSKHECNFVRQSAGKLEVREITYNLLQNGELFKQKLKIFQTRLYPIKICSDRILCKEKVLGLSWTTC